MKKTFNMSSLVVEYLLCVNLSYLIVNVLNNWSFISFNSPLFKELLDFMRMRHADATNGYTDIRWISSPHHWPCVIIVRT